MRECADLLCEAKDALLVDVDVALLVVDFGLTRMYRDKRQRQLVLAHLPHGREAVVSGKGVVIQTSPAHE